ncbi:MAG: glycosyltransferase [Cytophagaceae bacterium]|nr:glycosyltransferase [Gemmatimonadaceae bacterium]
MATALRAWLSSDAAQPVLDLLAVWATTPGPRRNIDMLWGDGPPRWNGALASLSIAVCTRDRPESLHATLGRLQGAVGPGVDVLVVDNAPSSEATRALVARRYSHLRYVRENAPGLDRARNRAIEESTADVVAFCDDDALVSPGWAMALRSLFARNPDVSLATGLVLPASLDSEPARLFERYGGFGRGYAPRWLHAPAALEGSIAFRYANTGAWGTGTNLAIRRRIVRALGGFDPALDVGTPTNGGGDLEMMFRVLKAGGLMAYTPNAVVYHRHRETWRELVHQVDGWGTGMAAHLARLRRAFPEERGAVAALRTWLAVAWFARRYASSWVRPTFPRELILAEWRASFRGAGLYREASRDLPPPGRPRPLHGVARVEQAVQGSVALEDTSGPLSFAEARTADVTVTSLGRTLGKVPLPVIGGVVGEDRWRHAVAGAFRRELLGATDAELRRKVVALFDGSRP